MTVRFATRSTVAAALVLLLGIGAGTHAATDDRAYLLGDDDLENGVPGNVIGVDFGQGPVTLDSQGPSGAFLDISVFGAPTYVSVSDRPGAAPGTVGGSFAGPGSGQYLSTPISMSSPSFMWNNPDFFPITPFALNYQGILGQGIQGWVKPDSATQGVRQDIVINTPQNGIFITSANNWGLQYAGGSISSASPVDFGEWNHVMQIAGFNDPDRGLSNHRGALLVNGVAVAAGSALYANSLAPLSIAGSADGGNLFHGILDDVRLFLWGDNSRHSDGSRVGQDWGRLNLAEDNEWIALQLQNLGVTSPGDVNMDGVVDHNDVLALIAGYNTERVVNGIRVGDWLSRQAGDLNFDGVVDLKDAFILNEALIAATGAGFDFRLLTGGAQVPEPASAVLLLLATAAVGATYRRRAAHER